MTKNIIEQRRQYVFVQAIQAGNAKDGFVDYTGDYHLTTIVSSTELTMRYLTRVARDLLVSRMFHWSARSTRAMSRLGIDLVRYGTSGTLIHILYRGHYIGEIKVDSLCQCSDSQRSSHWTRACATRRRITKMSRFSERLGRYYLCNEHANDDEYLDSSRETRNNATTNCYVPGCYARGNVAVSALVEEDDLAEE